MRTQARVFGGEVDDGGTGPARRGRPSAVGRRARGARRRSSGGSCRQSLVRVCDLAGRPRGAGFVADHHGTVITSHEAVDGLARLVLHAPATAAAW